MGVDSRLRGRGLWTLWAWPKGVVGVAYRELVGVASGLCGRGLFGCVRGQSGRGLLRCGRDLGEVGAVRAFRARVGVASGFVGVAYGRCGRGLSRVGGRGFSVFEGVASGL